MYGSDLIMMIEAYFDPFPRSKENIYWNKKENFQVGSLISSYLILAT